MSGEALHGIELAGRTYHSMGQLRFFSKNGVFNLGQVGHLGLEECSHFFVLGRAYFVSLLSALLALNVIL